MTAGTALLSVMWAGMTAYVLFGGADFGGGFWDLFAGSARRGLPTRRLIEHSLGPVWETNHVWLIFVVVVLWTGFPTVFAAVASTLYIPLTAAALGIIARGAGFAFRKSSTELWQQRLYGAAFAFSSVVTPFFLGTVAGAVASGRVPPGLAAGDILDSWWNPTSIITGLLSVAVGAYLAAAYLTQDAVRAAPDLVAGLRRRALLAGSGAGAVAAAGLLVLRSDAPSLYGELVHGRAAVLTALSAVSGVASLALLAVRRYIAVRVTAALTVTAVLWAWGAGQYPLLLPPGTSVTQAQASAEVLTAVLATLSVGAVLLVPSLLWLYMLFQRDRPRPAGAGPPQD
jgi:cytochrome d ubiquinol oxidase subunit II